MAKGKSYNSGGLSSEDRLNYLEGKKLAAINAKDVDAIKKYSDAVAQVTKNIERQNILQEASLTNMTEMSDSIKSLGAGLGKNNKLFETMNLFSSQMEGTVTSISSMLNGKTLKGSSAFAKQTYKAVDAYKSLGNTIAINGKKLAKQQLTTSQYNQSILDSYEDLEEQIERLSGQMRDMNQEQITDAKKVIATLEEQKNALESAAKGAERSKKNLEGMGFALNKLSSTGIPAMEEFGDVIMKAKEGGAGLTLGMAALGFAAGKAAYDLGLVGDKLGTIAKYDGQIAMVQARVDAKMKKFDLGMGGPGMNKNFVAAEAAINFGLAATQARLEFEAASKTALFGEGLGSVGYGTSQLQMAGISAEKIASAMKETSKLMGSNVSSKFGANIAILAERTGQSESSIASINDFFMRSSNTSAEVALNMQEGLRAMAKQAHVNLGGLMEDIAEASKDALSYQIKSGPALAKAATFAASLGTKFTDIANAGKNMVLNYKDSIKAEMSLSAMLGKRVDLSQVRALFAAGRTEEALKALKAQGLDPSTMNMFQQEALKNATGGLDLNSLQKVATRTGVEASLGQGNVGKQNEIFISTKSSAESAKMIGQEVASAMADLAKTEQLQGQKEKQKQDNILANTDGVKDDMKELLQLQKKKEIESSGVGYGLIGAGLGVALTLLLRKGKGLGKILSKGSGMSNIFGKGAPKAMATTAMSSEGASISNGLKFNSTGKVVNAQNGRFVSSAEASAFKSSRSLVQPKGTFAKPGMSFTNSIKPGGTAMALEEGIASSAVKGGSKMGKFMKVGGGALSVLGAGMDFMDRKEQGQSNFEAGLGTAGGAAGGWAGAELGASIGAFAGPVGAVIGGLLGGAVGYFGGSSIADALTGANRPTTDAAEATTVAVENLTSEQIAAKVKTGELLDNETYGLELQARMIEMMGLQLEYLNDIAETNSMTQDVKLDGAKVLSILNSRYSKAYGVARDIMPGTVVSRKG
jgi:hypothetical protein